MRWVRSNASWTTSSAAARSVCDNLGNHYQYASYHPTHLPSPHHPPPEYAGRGLPSSEAGNRVLWDNNAREANVLFGPTLNGHRASLGMPLVGDLRAYAYTERPWLASDPTLGPWPQPAEIDVVQTGTVTAPAEPNIAHVGAPALWDLGIDGTGVVVATLDSGVDLGNPDLAERYRGGANSWFDPYGQHGTPTDLTGHGTAVMGVAIGGSSGGTTIGVAPGALPS